MALKFQEDPADRLLEVTVSGKLSSEDYRIAAPAVDQFIREQGKINLLFDMHNFHGWRWGAMWEDFKFGRTHRQDLERLALVGEKKWQKWSSKLCSFFTDAEVRYFDRNEVEQAQTWVRGH